MIDPKIKELRGSGRRDFLRWGATAAACMGLSRSRLLNVINDVGGSALADVVACINTKNVFSIVAGNGSLAWKNNLFPFKAQALSTDPNISFYAPGTGVKRDGYDREFYAGANTPFADGKWKVSAFVGGNNETHTAAPVSLANLGGGNAMLASLAAIQQSNPTLLPVLTVGAITFGTAPGAPGVASVNAQSNLIDLFNSQASRTLLAGAANGGLSDQYYKAFLGLNASAGRSTFAKQYGVGKVSMNLLAKNLSAQLTPSAADEALFGINAAMDGTVANMGRGFIIASKAMGLGLTSMLIMRSTNDDPHGAYGNGNAMPLARTANFASIFNGLQKYLETFEDPGCSAKTLSDRTMLTIHGDTYKAPFNRNGWGDNTPMGTNLLFVASAGNRLKRGWFGDVTAANTALGWDTETGANIPFANGAMLGQSAAAAALYENCGDDRTVRQFFPTGAPGGAINLNLTG